MCAMFLEELQPEEKLAFLELAALIAKIDGKLSIYESSILEKYQKEMGLENYRKKGLGIGDILKIFMAQMVSGLNYSNLNKVKRC